MGKHFGIPRAFAAIARRLLAPAACLAALSAQAAPGVTGDEVVLGQSVYLTGALAELGQDFTAGANAYFEQVNRAGGVNGRRVRVVTLDDAYDPKKALANVEALTSQGVFALWQFAGTGTVREVAVVADRQQIPLVGAIATGPALRATAHPMTFYIRAGNREELRAVVDHLHVIGVTRVAALYVKAAYGTEGLAEIDGAMKARGAELVGRVPMGVNGENADEAAAQLAAMNPQAVVMVTVPASTKAFVRAARKLRLNSQLYALNAGLPIGAARELGDDAYGVVVCQVMPNVQDTSIPVVAEFRAAMKAQGRTGLTSAGLEGFIDAKVMTEALRRAGKDLSRARLVSALEGMSDFDAGGYAVHFSGANHAGGKKVELSIISAHGERFIY